MNTIFLCLCGGLPPKPVISLAESKVLVQSIRQQGIAASAVPLFIERCAPHQMAEGLLSQWQEEFLPEVVEPYIIDARDASLEAVLRVLRQNCHIKSPVKKAPAKNSAVKL